jgi:hypothetical protein
MECYKASEPRQSAICFLNFQISIPQHSKFLGLKRSFTIIMFKLLDILQHLVSPIIFMSMSASYLPGTVLTLLLTFNFSTLISPSKFKDVWFARFWADYGPGAREGASVSARPLIEQAYGVVVEIGPGNGEWVGLYDQKKVTRVYGIEPNKDHHVKLRQRVVEAGLSDIYIICGVGVEDLGDKWVKRGEVDCVVTVRASFCFLR